MCECRRVCVCVWRLASGCGYCDVVCSVRKCPCRPVASAVVRKTCVLVGASSLETNALDYFNPLTPELNPICYLLALLAHHFLHVSRIRVKLLTIRLLMSYIYIYIYIWSTYS